MLNVSSLKAYSGQPAHNMTRNMADEPYHRWPQVNILRFCRVWHQSQAPSAPRNDSRHGAWQRRLFEQTDLGSYDTRTVFLSVFGFTKNGLQCSHRNCQALEPVDPGVGACATLGPPHPPDPLRQVSSRPSSLGAFRKGGPCPLLKIPMGRPPYHPVF